MICQFGATAGYDFKPVANGGDPITCKVLIEDAKIFEAGTKWCATYEKAAMDCCPSVVQNPCRICPDGPSYGGYPVQDFAPNINDSTMCSDLISRVELMLESDSAQCIVGLGHDIEHLCCPPVVENPCVICPDGASAGTEFVPYANDGGTQTCREIIEAYMLVEAGSENCIQGGVSEANCCPPVSYLMPALGLGERTGPEHPCEICYTAGATVAGGNTFSPFSTSSSCGELIGYAKVTAAGSDACQFFEGYECSCCPDDVYTTAPLKNRLGIPINMAKAGTPLFGLGRYSVVVLIICAFVFA